MIITLSSSPLTTFDTHHLNTQNSLIFHQIQSCKSPKELKQIHAFILKTCQPLQTQQFLRAKILSLCAYVRPFRDLNYIFTLFTQCHDPNISRYNTVIKCFSGSKRDEDCVIALLFFQELIGKGLVPDNYTYPFVLKACVQLRALREGEMVHAHVLKNGFVSDLYVVNTLMRLYGVCGVVEDVRKVFDRSPQRDLVSWTILIQGYVDNGYWKEGVEVFFHVCELGYRGDEKLMVVVISACAKLGDLSLGRKLHEYMHDFKVKFDVFVGNALVDMYLKCGDSDSARKVFNEMPVRNVVSWNTLISGFAQNAEFKEALNVFTEMQSRGIKPDAITLVSVLNSCANLGVLELGKWVHAYLDGDQIDADGIIGNALIDMYAKCGSIEDAVRVFKSMKETDVYTYTAMIVGLAMHGEGEMALKLFSNMLKFHIEPNEVTFVGVLSACSHSGCVEEGRKHFMDMVRVHKLKPQAEHYGCMVDLLGRAGLIDEAVKFVENMPVEPDALIWGALLGACRIYENVELAEHVMEKLAELEHEKDGAYVLMSNIYASANKLRDAFTLRKAMRKMKIKKTPGCSCIEVDGVVYEFQKGDERHPESKSIYLLLEAMKCHLNSIEESRCI